MPLDAPTIAALTSVAGATVLVVVLMQYIVLPVLKLAPATQDRFGPLLAIATGIAVCVLAGLLQVVALNHDTVLAIAQDVINGIFAGLAAIGAHSVGTQTLGLGQNNPSS